MHQHLNYRGPRRREKERVWENFQGDYSWKFPQHGKGIVSQAQEAQRVPRRYTPRCKLIKLTKTKHKEIILKAAREKQQVTYKGTPKCLTDLSAEILQARGNGRIYLKYWKGKIYDQYYSTRQGSHSKISWNKMLFRQTKVKRIQYHQTSFTTNVKGNYIVKK